MPSATPSSSSQAPQSFQAPTKMSYMEIYEATYSIGDISERGQRVWHDGVIVLHTFNNKIFLCGERGLEIAKGFYTPLSSASPKIEIDAYGRYVPTLQKGSKYQLFDGYTVEIESLRSHQERPIDALSLRRQARITKEKKIPEWTKDQLKKAEDILPAVLKKPLKEDTSETAGGEKNNSSPLAESDVNTSDSNIKKRRFGLDLSDKFDAASDISTISSKTNASANPYRISGLSKKTKTTF